MAYNTIYDIQNGMMKLMLSGMHLCNHCSIYTKYNNIINKIHAHPESARKCHHRWTFVALSLV